MCVCEREFVYLPLPRYYRLQRADKRKRCYLFIIIINTSVEQTFTNQPAAMVSRKAFIDYVIAMSRRGAYVTRRRLALMMMMMMMMIIIKTA